MNSAQFKSILKKLEISFYSQKKKEGLNALRILKDKLFFWLNYSEEDERETVSVKDIKQILSKLEKWNEYAHLMAECLGIIHSTSRKRDAQKTIISYVLIPLLSDPKYEGFHHDFEVRYPAVSTRIDMVVSFTFAMKKLQIAIEVDEKHHEKQLIKDKEREKRMKERQNIIFLRLSEKLIGKPQIVSSRFETKVRQAFELDPTVISEKNRDEILDRTDIDFITREMGREMMSTENLNLEHGEYCVSLGNLKRTLNRLAEKNATTGIIPDDFEVDCFSILGKPDEQWYLKNYLILSEEKERSKTRKTMPEYYFEQQRYDKETENDEGDETKWSKTLSSFFKQENCLDMWLTPKTVQKYLMMSILGITNSIKDELGSLWDEYLYRKGTKELVDVYNQKESLRETLQTQEDINQLKDKERNSRLLVQQKKEELELEIESHENTKRKHTKKIKKTSDQIVEACENAMKGIQQAIQAKGATITLEAIEAINNILCSNTQLRIENKDLQHSNTIVKLEKEVETIKLKNEILEIKLECAGIKSSSKKTTKLTRKNGVVQEIPCYTKAELNQASYPDLKNFTRNLRDTPSDVKLTIKKDLLVDWISEKIAN